MTVCLGIFKLTLGILTHSLFQMPLWEQINVTKYSEHKQTHAPFVNWCSYQNQTHKQLRKTRKSPEQYDLAWTIFNHQITESNSLLLENFIFFPSSVKKTLHFILFKI